MFNLPIPVFDPAVPLHADLARVGALAEQVAATVIIPEAEKFVAARKRVRAALIEHGVSVEIERLVGQLLGPA